MPNSETNVGPIGGAVITAIVAGLFHGTIGTHPAVLILSETADAMPQQSAAPISLGEYAVLMQIVVIAFLLLAGLTALALGRIPGGVAFVSGYLSGLFLPTYPDAGVPLLVMSLLLALVATALYGGGADPQIAY